MEDKTVIALKYKVYRDKSVTIYRNQEDRVHCEEGPAIVWASGRQVWYHKGKLHRENGPAVIDPDGAKEWWFDGIRYFPDSDSV